MDFNQKELEENKEFFRLKIKPMDITMTILEIIGGHLDENILILHFGQEDTFSEIMKIIKGINDKIDISYLHIIHYK
ncbi:MAG: hypothetical protein ACFFAS_15235 [Promethearchaeota archaeon]